MPKEQPEFYGEYTVEDSAFSIPSGDFTPSKHWRKVFIRFGGGDMLYRVDGQPVTLSSGIPVLDGYEKVFSFSEAKNLSAIRSGTENGKLYVVFYDFS